MFTNHVNVCVYSVSQSCLILCDPMDCSLSGSSVHGIFQARILQWVAISSSRGSSQPRDGTRISCFSCIAGRFFTTEPHQGSPAMYIYIGISIYLPTYLPTCLSTYYTRRSNQSILKEISPGCSLEGMMLRLKLQYFGHLMRKVDSLEKTLMLGGIGGRRRKGRQRMRWLDGITDSMDVSLSELR